VLNVATVLRRQGASWISKPADDYLETSLDLNEFLVQNRAATFLMRVDGDSMKDAGILDGDLLGVDRAAKPVSGSIVVVALNGEYTVKRLRRNGDCVWLDPANPRIQADRGHGRRGSSRIRSCLALHSYITVNDGTGLRDHRLQQLLCLL